ncbi:MAG: Dabb family protein [Acidobacteriota bacterium]
MLDHYVMFKLKPECRQDLPEVVRRLRQLEKDVPAIRFAEVIVDDGRGIHSYDVLFHIRVDSLEAFRQDYMLHPKHVPVQNYIEARVCGIADVDRQH